MLGDICVSNPTIIDSDNGLSPGRRQASTWTNSGILWIGPLGTNFSEILIGIHTFSYKKMHLELSHAKWEPFCLALNMFTHYLLLSYDIPFVHMCQMLVNKKLRKKSPTNAPNYSGLHNCFIVYKRKDFTVPRAVDAILLPWLLTSQVDQQK